MKKRIISVALFLCLTVTVLPTIAFGAGMPFSDVEPASWYHESVQYAYDRGLMSGTSSSIFSPDANLTRAQLCQLFYNMEKQPETTENAFSDVSIDSWYYKAVNWAAENQIVSGVGNGKFNPASDITREQMVTLIYNYSVYKGYDLSDAADISAYIDASTISSWAETSMKWAVGKGFITGMSATTIEPVETATRAQAAAILMRFRTNIRKVVYAETTQEIADNIASNTEIRLSGKTYVIQDEFYRKYIDIANIENFSIVGTEGTEIANESGDDVVIRIYRSRDISIESIIMGHTPIGDICTAGVLSVYRSSNVSINDCDIYGCGQMGFDIYGSQVAMKNTTIRDCSLRIGEAYDSDVSFDNCTFSNNGYDTEAPWFESEYAIITSLAHGTDYGMKMTFNNCTFVDNKKTFFKLEKVFVAPTGSAMISYKQYKENYNEGHTTMTDCTFINNGWQ